MSVRTFKDEPPCLLEPCPYLVESKNHAKLRKRSNTKIVQIPVVIYPSHVGTRNPRQRRLFHVLPWPPGVRATRTRCWWSNLPVRLSITGAVGVVSTWRGSVSAQVAVVFFVYVHDVHDSFQDSQGSQPTFPRVALTTVSLCHERRAVEHKKSVLKSYQYPPRSVHFNPAEVYRAYTTQTLCTRDSGLT